VEASNPFVATMPQSSVAIYSEALELAMKVGRFVGLNVLDEDYRPVNVMSMVIVLDLITFTMVTVYCCFEYYGNLEKIVFCIVNYGFVIQVEIFRHKDFRYYFCVD
jgi:hypothetical protein